MDTILGSGNFSDMTLGEQSQELVSSYVLLTRQLASQAYPYRMSLYLTLGCLKACWWANDVPLLNFDSPACACARAIYFLRHVIYVLVFFFFFLSNIHLAYGLFFSNQSSSQRLCNFVLYVFESFIVSSVLMFTHVAILLAHVKQRLHAFNLFNVQYFSFAIARSRLITCTRIWEVSRLPMREVRLMCIFFLFC